MLQRHGAGRRGEVAPRLCLALHVYVYKANYANSSPGPEQLPRALPGAARSATALGGKPAAARAQAVRLPGSD